MKINKKAICLYCSADATIHFDTDKRNGLCTNCGYIAEISASCAKELEEEHLYAELIEQPAPEPQVTPQPFVPPAPIVRKLAPPPFRPPSLNPANLAMNAQLIGFDPIFLSRPTLQ